LLAAAFRAKSWPVLFIQHDGRAMNEFVPFTTEWELLDNLKMDASDIRIDKYANDVFYRSELGQKLDMLAINDLVITGCATDFRVESTIQSAVSKDYNVTVIEDGHTGNGLQQHLDFVVSENLIDYKKAISGELVLDISVVDHRYLRIGLQQNK
jgi:nicotinamidase-related amidase